MWKRLVLTAILLASAVLAGGPVAADEVSAPVAAARRIITDQLAAFARDDAAAAYDFAAPEVKAKFPTPDIFMLMVRKGYSPVYRPQSYDFSTSEETADGLVRQEVDIIDADGAAWTAEYMLRREADGTLKIISCRLVRKPGVGA